ncbi:MAG: minichromosome maintenance protein MCM [Candidatus Nanopusillus acidilobi]
MIENKEYDDNDYKKGKYTNDEIEAIVNEFWEKHLQYKIWSGLDGADEREWVLDLKKFENNSNSEDFEGLINIAKEYQGTDKYDEVIDLIVKTGETQAIAKSEQDLYDALIDNPEFTLQKLNERLDKETEWNKELTKTPEFKIINAPIYKISELTDKQIGKLIEVRGIIKMLSPNLNRIKVGYWRCESCGHINVVEGPRRPKYCEGCGKRATIFTLLEDITKMETYREALIQESPDEPKRQYDSILINIPTEFINSYFLGDKVAVVGILRTIQKQNNKDIREFYIDVNNIYMFEDNKIELTQDDINKIKEFSKREDLLDALAKMYAPSIIGHEEIKKAIVLQAVGGVERVINGTRIRGNIHILLIGDPATAKSQLTMWNKNAVQKSIYVADASGAGLTISFIKNNDKMTWEAGALVLGNEGVVAIDEFEKMREEDREAIHPAMEQGKVSKAKAGFIITAPTNTSILASANPKFGRFDRTKLFEDQISLSSVILNRFDLIFFVLDDVNSEDKEYELALKILNVKENNYSDFLKKYIAYAKTFKPELSEEAKNKIADKYAKIRASGKGKKIPINARNLQAIVRIAEAHAKLRLDNTVTIKDVDVAISLISNYIDSLGNDIDALDISSNKREDAKKLLDIIKSYEYINYTKLTELAKSNDITDVDGAIQILLKNKDIIEIGNGYKAKEVV